MATTYLSKAISTNNVAGRKTMTFSAWIKRATNSATSSVFTTGSGAERDMILFESDGKLQFSRYDSSYIYMLKTNRQFKDTSAWYHLMCVLDTTQGTASNRMKIYVNGVQETSFNTANYPSQDYQSNYSQSGYTQFLGQDSDGNFDFDGCMSHVHYVDGTALTPSTFGSTDATTGEWKINTSPSVTYGTNGFFLLKNDNAVTDRSGQGNNFTLGAGTLTKTEDNPSNNFATVSAVIGNHTNGNALQPTLENASTTSVYGSGEWRIAQSTLGASSGKYYAEFKWINDSNTRYSYIGIYDIDGYAAKISGYPYMSDMANCYGLKDDNGNVHTGGSGTSYGVSYGPSNIIGVAMDLDNNKLYFSKDGVWMNSANPSNGTGGYSITADKTYVFGIQQYAVGYLRFAHNYGNGFFQTSTVSSAGSNASNNGIFEYDVPTGFTALSTKGLNL